MLPTPNAVLGSADLGHTRQPSMATHWKVRRGTRRNGPGPQHRPRSEHRTPRHGRGCAPSPPRRTPRPRNPRPRPPHREDPPPTRTRQPCCTTRCPASRISHRVPRPQTTTRRLTLRIAPQRREPPRSAQPPTRHSCESPWVYWRGSIRPRAIHVTHRRFAAGGGAARRGHPTPGPQRRDAGVDLRRGAPGRRRGGEQADRRRVFDHP
jgi:hypothetical protein